MSKGLAFLKSAVVALAMVGILFPQTGILAGQKTPAKPTVKVVAANSVLDVSLSKDGEFTGRAVSKTGAPIEGAKVVVKQGATEVAHSVTDRNGQFTVQDLKSGTYQVSSGSTEGSFRLWNEKSAPPKAKPYGLLVMGENGARGQIGMFDDAGGLLLVGALAATGLGLGIAGLVEANNAQSNADSANAALAQEQARNAALRQQLINNGIPVSP